MAHPRPERLVELPAAAPRAVVGHDLPHHDVRPSCGRTGRCLDNAAAESLFGTPKNGMHRLGAFATRREARDAVIGYVERHHNRSRPHSTIGCQVPAERMEAFPARVERAFSEEVVPPESAA